MVEGFKRLLHVNDCSAAFATECGDLLMEAVYYFMKGFQNPQMAFHLIMVGENDLHNMVVRLMHKHPIY